MTSAAWSVVAAIATIVGTWAVGRREARRVERDWQMLLDTSAIVRDLRASSSQYVVYLGSSVVLDAKVVLDELLKQSNARRRAARIFAWVEAALPKRMRNEQLGDALEEINTAGRNSAWIQMKIATTLFWLAINAIGEIMSVPWGRAAK
jgi:hypothetical protein